MSYLAVISNEIIFVPYREKLHKELDRAKDETAEKALNEILVTYSERTNKRNFEHYAKHTLLKDICHIRISRHTIYYERTQVAQEVDKVLNSKEEKLPLVVEVCSPNSLTTLNIMERLPKSHSAYCFAKCLLRYEYAGRKI